jgi:hypothetical protein
MKGIQTLKAAIAAALFLVTPMAANAVTIAKTNVLPTVAIANATPDATTGTYFSNVTGTISGTRRTPWEGTALAATGVYSSVSKGSSATFDFAKRQKSFSLVWGSPDKWNDLQVKLISGGATVTTINGFAIQPPAGVLAALVTVTDVVFDRLTFVSTTNNAFEFANLTTTPVPLPAAGWMLIAGLGALGAVARKRKVAAAA